MQPLNTFMQFTLFVAAWLLLFTLFLSLTGLIWMRSPRKKPSIFSHAYL